MAMKTKSYRSWESDRIDDQDPLQTSGGHIVVVDFLLSLSLCFNGESRLYYRKNRQKKRRKTRWLLWNCCVLAKGRQKKGSLNSLHIFKWLLYYYMYRHWMMKTKGKIQDTDFLFFISKSTPKRKIIQFIYITSSDYCLEGEHTKEL